MTARNDESRLDEQFSRRESWRSVARSIDEPAELTEQAAAHEADRGRREQRCADCDQPRWAHGWKASTLRGGCVFVEVGA